LSAGNRSLLVGVGHNQARIHREPFTTDQPRCNASLNDPFIMLRSIAEIARSEGEDPSDPESALSCIQVFALGGRVGSTDASESGYFAVRGILAKSVTEAARFIAERGFIEEGAPALVRFITQVASRFGVVLSQKFAAQALPVVGTLGGASVNYVFIEHFQKIAQGHFTVRRLERAYGKDIVRAEYERLAQVTEAFASSCTGIMRLNVRLMRGATAAVVFGTW
jgi:hypothetical protein